MKGKQLTALGADIFAGLFTQGVQQAGYKILGHFEHGPYGVATARLNFPDLDIRIGPHAWKPEDYRGKVDLMYCNPPCAAWSGMRDGSKHNWKDQHERLQYVRDIVQAGQFIAPRAWCFESVLGAWRNGRDFILEQARSWNHCGYHVTILQQDNQYLGAPQQRQRMFLIAHKHPIVWEPFTKSMTAAQALKRVPKRLPQPSVMPNELTPLMAELWKRTPPPNSQLRNALILMTKDDIAKYPGSRPLNVYRRVLADQPAPVMLAADKRLHPTECRLLTWHEWLNLCGLPWNWKTGQRNFQAATLELARAVMPPVGEWLARSLAAGFDKPAVRNNQAVECRVIDLRKPDAILEEQLWKTRERNSDPVTWTPPEPTAPVRPVRAARSGIAPVLRVPGAIGSGQRIRDLLQLGHETVEILEIIHHEFQDSKATASDVSWNRGKLRKQGISI